MRRCDEIYEIVTVYYPTSCINTTRTTTSTSTTLAPTTTTTTTTVIPPGAIPLPILIGYQTISPPENIVVSRSLESLCLVVTNIINYNVDLNSGVVDYTTYYIDFDNSMMYNSVTNTFAEDGYYFTEGIFYVTNGLFEQVNPYVVCSITTTTTTSTSSTTTTTTTTQAPLSLKLTFDDIANANALVGDASSVIDWNIFFDLPTYGNPFTSVEVSGDTVSLFGGSNITIKQGLFNSNINLISIIDDSDSIISSEGYTFTSALNLTTVDLPSLLFAGEYSFGITPNVTSFNLPLLETAGIQAFGDDTTGSSGISQLTYLSLPSLTTAGAYCFYGYSALTTLELPLLTSAGRACFEYCQSLTTIDLPNLTTTGDYNLFQTCISLTTISLPVCTNLGLTVGDNYIFNVITGQTITLTVPSALMTCNGGNPDGDIQYLQANNTVTIITT